MRRKVIILLAVLYPAICLHAQDIKPATDTIGSLAEVTITATRHAAERLSVPYAVAVVTGKDIAAMQYRTTPEALAGTTGVFIQKTNHGGGSPFIRGLTGNQTLLMIDGVRFNNGTFRFGPNQYMNTIDAFTVEKLEVVRGSGSVQYGSDALGGVIQVFTKDPAFTKTRQLHGNITGKALTGDMEYTGRGELQYQSEKLVVLAGFTKRKFGDLIGGDTTGKQTPSGYREQAFDVKMKWKITDNVRFTAAHQYLQQNDVPLYHRVQLENFAYYNFAPQQRQMTYGKLEIDGSKTLIRRITLTTSLQQSHEIRSYQRNSNANRFLEDDRVKTIGLTGDISSAISNNWTVNTGVEFCHDKVNSSKKQISIATGNIVLQRGLYPDNASNGNFSLYTLHHINIRKFAVEAGLRYNSFAITIPDTATTVLKLGDVTVRPSSLVANAALLYHISGTQSVYSSFSTGYRTPNIDDLGSLGLVDFRWEIPAYNLQPEKTYNTEIGYRFSNKNIQASVSFFYMHLANLITRVQVPGQQVGGYNVYTKENSQESFLRGAELSFDWKMSPCLSLKTGASYAYGQNTSRSEPMRRIPPFNGRVLLNFNKQKWQAGVEHLFAGSQRRLAQGDRDDNRIPAGGTPGWNVLNLYSGYTVANVSFRLGMQNIFDADYRTHGSGINAMGRSGWLAVQFAF